jgi:hypothetical protein
MSPMSAEDPQNVPSAAHEPPPTGAERTSAAVAREARHDPLTGLPLLRYRFAGAPTLRPGDPAPDGAWRVLRVESRDGTTVLDLEMQAGATPAADQPATVDDDAAEAVLATLADAAALGVAHGDLGVHRLWRRGPRTWIEGYGVPWRDGASPSDDARSMAASLLSTPGTRLGASLRRRLEAVRDAPATVSGSVGTEQGDVSLTPTIEGATPERRPAAKKEKPKRATPSGTKPKRSKPASKARPAMEASPATVAAVEATVAAVEAPAPAVAAGSDPAPVGADPGMDVPEPTVAAPKAVAPAPEPPTPEPPAPEPAAPEPPAPEPVPPAPMPEPAAPEPPAPEAPASAPEPPAPEPAAPEPAPPAPTAKPVSPTAKPVSPTPKPVRPTPAVRLVQGPPPGSVLRSGAVGASARLAHAARSGMAAARGLLDTGRRGLGLPVGPGRRSRGDGAAPTSRDVRRRAVLGVALALSASAWLALATLAQPRPVEPVLVSRVVGHVVEVAIEPGGLPPVSLVVVESPPGSRLAPGSVVGSVPSKVLLDRDGVWRFQARFGGKVSPTVALVTPGEARIVVPFPSETPAAAR